MWLSAFSTTSLGIRNRAQPEEKVRRRSCSVQCSSARPSLSSATLRVELCLPFGVARDRRLAVGGEQKTALAFDGRKAGDRVERRRGQRHQVLDVVLGPRRRDDPLPGIEVEFGARRRADLVAALPSQDQQLHRRAERIAELYRPPSTPAPIPCRRAGACAGGPWRRPGSRSAWPDCRDVAAPSWRRKTVSRSRRGIGRRRPAHPRPTMASIRSCTSAAVMAAICRSFQKGVASRSMMASMSATVRRPLARCNSMNRRFTASNVRLPSAAGRRFNRFNVTTSAVGSLPSLTMPSVSRAAALASARAEPRIGPSVSLVGLP